MPLATERVAHLARMLVASRVTVGRLIDIDLIASTIAEWCPDVPRDQIAAEVLKAAVRQQGGVYREDHD